MKKLNVTIGRDERGLDIELNLSDVKHLFVSGRSGAGKSILLHNIITKLAEFREENLKLILVDLKLVEFTTYNQLPNLLTPVLNDFKKAVMALKWVQKEMSRRYDPDLEPNQPPIVIVIDEISLLMQDYYSTQAEEAIVNIAKMGHVVGIHIILATSTPTTKVFTPSMRNVIGARISFQTVSATESKSVIGNDLAFSLNQPGEFFYQSGNYRFPLFGTTFNMEVEHKLSKEAVKETSVFDSIDEFENESDDLYEQAKEVVIQAGKASTSYLQRKLRIGYARSAHLMDLLEERGVIGAEDGAKPRDVIVDR